MSVPKHVAFIMDGNRRFSRRLMLKPWKGHEWGVKKVKRVLEWCKESGIREITLYTFSIENFNRPKQEFDYLMRLFIKEFESEETINLIMNNKIRVNVIGRIWKFPEELQKAIKNLMDMTKENSEYTVNFAMAYGGRSEVTDAARRIAQQVQKGELDIDSINEDVFAKNLYLKTEPDLIIRTGGEKRLSNFLPFQGAYAELIFVESMWPDLKKEEFVEALAEYKHRSRRFGR